MVVCFAFGCTHHDSNSNCSFYRFPTDNKKRALWTRVSRRADREPGSSSRLCSCHFVDKKKENGPTIFFYNDEKRIETLSPEKKRLKKSIDNQDHEPAAEKTVNGENSVAVLQAENMFLHEEVENLKKALLEKSSRFSFSQISHSDIYVLMYTGLPNAAVFTLLLSYIQRLDFDYEYGWKVQALSLEDQLFIMLQKLRQNYTFMDLAVRYSVSDMTVRNIFFTFLSVIHESMYETYVENMPTLAKIQKDMPSTDFPNCRFLIDSTEIFIENPRGSLEAQRQTYSNYKKRQTFKALLAVAPNGVICFSSKLYPGSISDKMLFKESGLSKMLNPGDLILADKGFLIHDLLPKGVHINIPPFLINPQFTEQEAKFTTQLARKRIHVERAIQRIKSFEILNCIAHQYQASATKIFQVCALLVNLQNPILKQKVLN